MTTIQAALDHVNVKIDSDEAECLLANLIYKVSLSRPSPFYRFLKNLLQGHLKGYISHERQTVVLAKDKPFPDIIGKQLVI